MYNWTAERDGGFPCFAVISLCSMSRYQALCHFPHLPSSWKLPGQWPPLPDDPKTGVALSSGCCLLRPRLVRYTEGRSK